MSINSILKKEGIKVINPLDTETITKIATNISKTLIEAFPEHNLNESDLFIAIARINMYIADIPNDTAVAKYFYKNNSIYFSKDMNLDDLNTLAIHECMHHMQELKDNKGKLLRLGLYNREKTKETGMALNEAAVQHMASVATKSPVDTVKYYNMEFSTVSPDFYPLQTALLNELIYFTGSYPLYHSTLYANDVFKNTFIAKSNLKTYEFIEKNFDLILEYESRLSEAIYKLSICPEELKSVEKIKKLNSKIADYKSIIMEKTLETQNEIIVNCFNTSLNNIKTLDDCREFQSSMYNFKHVIITTDNYNFFNDFYIEMMNKLEEKKEYINQYGPIRSSDPITNELSNIEEKTYGFQFFKNLFSKLKLLLEDAIREKEY